MDTFENFPGRPDHPDFWKLSDIVLRNDGRMEDSDTKDEQKRSLHQLIEEFADVDSVYYMGIQRALRIFEISTEQQITHNADLIVRAAALYVDAFIVGAEYARRQGQEES